MKALDTLNEQFLKIATAPKLTAETLQTLEDLATSPYSSANWLRAASSPENAAIKPELSMINATFLELKNCNPDPENYNALQKAKNKHSKRFTAIQATLQALQKENKQLELVELTNADNYTVSLLLDHGNEEPAETQTDDQAAVKNIVLQKKTRATHKASLLMRMQIILLNEGLANLQTKFAQKAYEKELADFQPLLDSFISAFEKVQGAAFAAYGADTTTAGEARAKYSGNIPLHTSIDEIHERIKQAQVNKAYGQDFFDLALPKCT